MSDLRRREDSYRDRVSQILSALLFATLVIGACSRGSSGDNGEEAGESQRHDDVSDVPVPSVTTPDGFVPNEQIWHELWLRTPGTPRHECVDVDAHRDVRSGEFIVGNFATFIAGWDGTYETSKLYYIPAYPIDGQQLDVVAELLDGRVKRQEMFTFGGSAWTLRGAIPSTLRALCYRSAATGA